MFDRPSATGFDTGTHRLGCLCILAPSGISISPRGDFTLDMLARHATHVYLTPLAAVKVTGTIPCSLEIAKSLFSSSDAELIKNWDPDILKLVREMQVLWCIVYCVLLCVSSVVCIVHMHM